MKKMTEFVALILISWVGLGILAYSQTASKTSTLDRLRNIDVTNKRMDVETSGPSLHHPAVTQPNTLEYPTDAHDDASRRLYKANKLLRNPETIDSSLALLRKIIAEHPDYTAAYTLMGVAYGSKQNWDEAKKAFGKAVELEPTNAYAYIGLGAVENENKTFVEAENHLLKGVEFAPDSPDAHFELGRAYFGQGRWELADQQVAKANQLRTDSPQQHVFMGNILLRERNAEGALKEFQEAVRLDPHGPLAAPSAQMIERIQTAVTQQSAAQK